ncbi:hypothetical protein LTR36_008532 [Oleoguttula mirabilis]|uniref:Nudix hydrolase domain-containing protein n=1 Tax=Oleoguttula mirabilis TaxID=1507867 RepID=A0AAV9JVW8_9PEZI|nr:hypothetical protein LTR36_008532 [Oleoguttula mirabilis]
MPSSATARKVIGSKQDREYVERTAVRLIIYNGRGEIVILSVAKGSYLKLPGGGIEGEEDHTVAAEREAMEETGCRVSVGNECIGVCEEWRNDLHQLSYCYRARLIEDTGAVHLTEEELGDGLQHQWCAPEAALSKMRGSTPTTQLGQFIKERDSFFLEHVVV